MKSKKLLEINESKDNQKIELSNNQQNPGNAKPEEFEVQSEIPLHGQCGNSRAEYARLEREADLKREDHSGCLIRNTNDFSEHTQDNLRDVDRNDIDL